MKTILTGSICALLASVTAMGYASQPINTSDVHAPHSATVQQPVPPPRSNANIKLIIRAMGESSTWGHPDLFGQFAGMRRLFEGKYEGAMKYFKIGAYYADKLSQLSIGMMYLNGRGVSKDPATACAWITLASERGYPTYVNARDQICAALSPAQHDQAMATLRTLRPEYGDAVAKHRMAFQLRIDKNALTGSHLGHDSGVQTAASCGGGGLALGGLQIPRDGCRYDPATFNEKEYFAERDAQWFGTVTVGELHKVNPPLSDAPAKASDPEH